VGVTKLPPKTKIILDDANGGRIVLIQPAHGGKRRAIKDAW
jgi:hypothetical protein